MIPSFAERHLLEILRLSKVPILELEGKNRAQFDFAMKLRDGQQIAVEITSILNFPWLSDHYLYGARAAAAAGYDEFWIVVVGSARFNPIPKLPFPVLPLPCRVLSPKEFAVSLGVEDSRIQAEGIDATHDARQPHYQNLDLVRSQLPEWFRKTHPEDGSIARLEIGQRHERSVVVFSDIENFSDIVNDAEPDLVNEMLHKYYRCARDLVRTHGGTFDKFIGDAVLALFNYPKGAKSPFRSSIEFSMDLIEKGGAILDDFLKKDFVRLRTGTRVGIATGEVRPIDVGSDLLQISFIGKPVNRAERLQKTAPTDGIAVCQLTFSYLQDEDPAFAKLLEPAPKQRRRGSMKGINRTARTQVISAATIKRLKAGQP